VSATAQPLVQPFEQLRYALLLDWGTRIGLVVLVATFAAYVFGWADPFVPLDRLPELWSHPVGRYLQETGSPAGWGWIALAGRGDVAGLVGIAILAGCSVICLLALVPMYLRDGDRAYAALCTVEALVILVAASGWMGGGH